MSSSAGVEDSGSGGDVDDEMVVMEEILNMGQSEHGGAVTSKRRQSVTLCNFRIIF